MLRRIKLENFRSWQNLDIELAPITVLFGANNSGKSNILSALLLLKQTSRVEEPINFGSDSVRDYVDFGNYKEMVFNNNEDLSVGIKIRWDQPKNTSGIVYVDEAELGNMKSPLPPFPTYSVSWQKIDDRVSLKNLAHHYNEQESSFYVTGEPSVHDDKWQYLYSYSRSQKHKEGVPPRSCFLISSDDHDSRILFSFFANLMNDIAYLGPVRLEPEREYPWRDVAPYQIGKRGEDTIRTLIAAQREKSKNGNGTSEAEMTLIENVRKWLIEIGVVSDFRVESFDTANRYYRTSVRTTDVGSEGTLADVGFGVSQVLPVITLLFFAEPGSTLLLEQPELHLHPHAQSVLADLMLEVAEKRNLQLIVESHSEHLLRRFQRRIAESNPAFAKPENIKTYFCEMTKNGSQIQEVQVDKYGQINNWPKGFFGDISSDVDAAFRAGVEKRKRELANG